MKLTVGLIVLAAMLSLATASPMAEVGRDFATGGHAFAPGAGGVGQGARLNAPPERFMALAPELRNGGYKAPPPGMVKGDTHAQEPSESVHDQLRKLLGSLLYVTHEAGTPYESLPFEATSLRGAAEAIMSTAGKEDGSAGQLSEHLAILAKEVEDQKKISPVAYKNVKIALDQYFESHPAVLHDYTATVGRLRVDQLRLLGRETNRLRQHSMAQEQQMIQMRYFLQAMFDTLPENTQLAIRQRVQQIEDASRKKAAQFEQDELARANYEAHAQANSQYGRSGASDPASLQKETSDESIYTQSAANPAVNAHNNNPAGGSNGFQSTRGSMTGENAVHNSHIQPIAEGQFNGLHHDGSLADRKAATPVTNQDHGSNRPHEYYDGEDDEDWDDEDWDWGEEELSDRAREHVDGKKTYDFGATKHSADHDGVKNANPESIETNHGHRPVPILSERNHQPSPAPATVA